MSRWMDGDRETVGDASVMFRDSRGCMGYVQRQSGMHYVQDAEQMAACENGDNTERNSTTHRGTQQHTEGLTAHTGSQQHTEELNNTQRNSTTHRGTQQHREGFAEDDSRLRLRVQPRFPCLAISLTSHYKRDPFRLFSSDLYIPTPLV